MCLPRACKRKTDFEKWTLCRIKVSIYSQWINVNSVINILGVYAHACFVTAIFIAMAVCLSFSPRFPARQCLQFLPRGAHLHIRTYSKCVPRRRETSLPMIFAAMKQLLSSRNRQGRICLHVLPAWMDNDLIRLNLNRQLIPLQWFRIIPLPLNRSCSYYKKRDKNTHQTSNNFDDPTLLNCVKVSFPWESFQSILKYWKYHLFVL